jgi:hypothetical protein
VSAGREADGDHGAVLTLGEGFPVEVLHPQFPHLLTEVLKPYALAIHMLAICCPDAVF